MAYVRMGGVLQLLASPPPQPPCPPGQVAYCQLGYKAVASRPGRWHRAPQGPGLQPWRVTPAWGPAYRVGVCGSGFGGILGCGVVMGLSGLG